MTGFIHHILEEDNIIRELYFKKNKFLFLLITKEQKNDFFFFRKSRYFNSLSNAIHPIQIHRAVLKKLRFEKKVKKILTSNISEIYGPIILPKELDRDLSKIYLCIVGHTKLIFIIFQFFP